MICPQPLALILNDPILLSHIIDSRLRGEIEALNRFDANLPRNHRGTVAYHETLRELCARLLPLGFIREEENNQVRLISPPSANGVCCRLLICKGVVSGTHAEVNPKGKLTRHLILHENPSHFLRLPLFELEELPPLNIWCIASVFSDSEGTEQLGIHLTIPHELNNDGTEFECMESVSIYSGELTTASIPPIDQPDSVDIDIDFGDKDGTND
ncbi:MAG: hypothetical protein NT023_13270 [Armatimonadetes bacterium]|nr:hypothetical protein [Armatimonadota bacterium]